MSLSDEIAAAIPKIATKATTTVKKTVAKTPKQGTLPESDNPRESVKIEKKK